MHEPFSAKDWMRLALQITADGRTDLDEVLDTLRRAARADLGWVIRELYLFSIRLLKTRDCSSHSNDSWSVGEAKKG